MEQFSGVYNQWPGQHQPPTPPPSLSRGFVSPPPSRSNAFTVGELGFTHNTHVRTPRTSRFFSTEECINKFREWRSGKGTLSSPKNREKSLFLKVSMRDFVNFKKFLRIYDENDEKFPTYTYNKASSMLTIQCAPSPIHEKAVSTISKGFHLAFGALPADTQSKINIVANQKFERFYGKYAGSEKIPDIAIQVRSNQGVEVKFILEVGLSESYEKLVQDAQLWLEGTRTVSVVMLIKIHEDAAYRSPTHDLTEAEFENLQFPPKEGVIEENFLLSGPYGPATYKGLIWVGSISGFIEMWGFKGTSRLASRISDRIHGHLDLHRQSTIQIHKPYVQDLLTADESTEYSLYLNNFVDVANSDSPIRFDWITFLGNLKYHIKELAANRCYRTLKDRNGQANASDYDFLPPSPASSFSSASSP